MGVLAFYNLPLRLRTICPFLIPLFSIVGGHGGAEGKCDVCVFLGSSAPFITFFFIIFLVRHFIVEAFKPLFVEWARGFVVKTRGGVELRVQLFLGAIVVGKAVTVLGGINATKFIRFNVLNHKIQTDQSKDCGKACWVLGPTMIVANASSLQARMDFFRCIKRGTKSSGTLNGPTKKQILLRKNMVLREIPLPARP